MSARRPLIACAPTDWATAIQLCVPVVQDERMVGLQPHALSSDTVLAFAGRALLPTTLTAALPLAGASEGQSVLQALLHKTGGASCVTLACSLHDARFAPPVSPFVTRARRPATRCARPYPIAAG